MLPTTGWTDSNTTTLAIWMLAGGVFVAYLRRRRSLFAV
ncbi:MAG: LPXTG cell wall anchor domain-containing protein [Actinobacteria bacterium]|nr:LPXTG cell wall anchor domain-containing protein [Actinomycetota bacterium]